MVDRLPAARLWRQMQVSRFFHDRAAIILRIQ